MRISALPSPTVLGQAVSYRTPKYLVLFCPLPYTDIHASLPINALAPIP